MKQKRLYKVFIWGFLFLYLLVAAISFFHAIQFFNVGNNVTMSVVLAFAFEVGLALSLAAVLLSDANKKATLPWILMIVLTGVQVIGNVFSTYKYMALSETEYYQYLAKPLLFWMEGITEESVQIVVSWIIGAILPIIALFMTDMVATNIKNLAALENGEPEKKQEPVEEHIEEPIEEVTVPEEISHETKPEIPELKKMNVNEPVRFDAGGFLDDENIPEEKQEESIPSTEKSVTDQINDADADFSETAVSEAKVPAEKKSLLKKIGNGLKNLWIKG